MSWHRREVVSLLRKTHVGGRDVCADEKMEGGLVGPGRRSEPQCQALAPGASLAAPNAPRGGL